MNFADWGNAAFELGGGILIWLNVLKLYRDKMVRGVHWGPIGFFAGWGYWNIYFYWAVDAPLSWWAGIAVVAANSVWWGQILYYSWRERSGYRWQPSYIDGTDTVLAHWTKEKHIFDAVWDKMYGPGKGEPVPINIGEIAECPQCGGYGQDHYENCPLGGYPSAC